MFPLYDAHAHLADSRLKPSLPEILQECQRQHVRGILINAASCQDWQDVLAFKNRPDCRIAIGIHPFFVQEWTASAQQELSVLLAEHPSCTVGEIGLDAWEGRQSIPQQRDAFAKQLAIAVQHRRVVSIHNRKTWTDFFEVLDELQLHTLHGICHHFTGSREVARKLLDLGLFLSFCSPITSPNAHRLHDVARYVPSDRILTETDCPDMPVRGLHEPHSSRPWHVREVILTLAELRQTSPENMADTVEQNWRQLFAPSH